MFELEGLMNDARYLRDLGAGRLDGAYLLGRGVGYYVYSGFKPEELTGECRALSEPQLGGGPKARITVCDANLVYRHRFGNGEMIGVRKLVP